MELTPKFYVASQPDTSDLLSDGEHQLVVPIVSEEKYHCSFSNIPNIEMRSRVSILVPFIEGLIHLYSESCQANEPCQAALSSFEEATKEAENRDDLTGLEALYLFEGYAYYLLNNDEEAIASYERALDLNHQYARVHIGIGL